MRHGVGFEDADEVLLELRFGEGGEDSKLFVSELFSAYTKYAAAKGLKVEGLNMDHGHILAKVTGHGAFKAFRNETGQHACQRVPHTERSGRRHTSLIAVAVLPIREDVWEPLPASEMEITPQMCKLHSGGQNAQRNATAIRAIHTPTGISVFIQNERSQKQNREQAISILTARVNDARQAKDNADYARFRKDALGDGRRGSKVRTYNFIQQRAVDHRLGTKTTRVDLVMAGRLDLLVK